VGVTNGALLEIDAGEGEEEFGPGQVGDLGHEAHRVDGGHARAATVVAGKGGLGGGEAAVDVGGRQESAVTDLDEATGQAVVEKPTG
jgi:hypothetical protein